MPFGALVRPTASVEHLRWPSTVEVARADLLEGPLNSLVPGALTSSLSASMRVMPRGTPSTLSTAMKCAFGNIFPTGKRKVPGLLIPSRFEARFKPLRFSNAKARHILGWVPPFFYEACLDRRYGSGAAGGGSRMERQL